MVYKIRPRAFAQPVAHSRHTSTHRREVTEGEQAHEGRSGEAAAASGAPELQMRACAGTRPKMQARVSPDGRTRNGHRPYLAIAKNICQPPRCATSLVSHALSPSRLGSRDRSPGHLKHRTDPHDLICCAAAAADPTTALLQLSSRRCY